MASIHANVRGMNRARQRLLTYRTGLKRSRSLDLFNRRAVGSYQVGATIHTPSPVGGTGFGPSGDPQSWKDSRTGNLLSTVRVNFINRDTLRVRWGAPYASNVNNRGRSAGYVQRSIQEGNRRFQKFLDEERRKHARRVGRAVRGGSSGGRTP